VVRALDSKAAAAGAQGRDFVGQALEVIPVGRDDGGLFWLKPLHSDSLRVGLPANARPAEVVVDVLKSYPLTALAVHSASWRHEEGTTVLTYVAAVEPPAPEALASFAPARIAPDEAAQTSPVVAHALRHVAWLRLNEPVVANVLAGWDEALEGFEPEPFRALVLDA
jgi:hypothetical protein